MATTQINLRLPDELLARVDEARGMIPRNRWLTWAAERALGFTGTPEFSLPSERPYRQSVPGPNVENVRSSAQAKRNVKPMPKRGKK